MIGRTKLYARRFNPIVPPAGHQALTNDAATAHMKCKCKWSYTGVIDQQMAVMTNCTSVAPAVIAYRYSELDPWKHIAYCNAHGGLLRAELEFVEIARDQPIHWE